MQAIARLCNALLAEMDSVGVAPNSFTFNALLSVHSQCRDETMFTVFARMQEAEERQRNVVATSAQAEYINLAAGPPKFRELEELFERHMQAQSNAQPTSADDVQAGRLGAPGVRMTIETFSIMIEGCHRMGLPNKAFELFQLMKMKRAEAGGDKKLMPDRTIFIKLIDVCAMALKKEKAEDLFNECLASDILPDTDLYNALLNVLAECCHPDVHLWFNRLKGPSEGLSVKPNQDSYNIMLKAALKTSSMDEAKKLYREMTSPTCLVSPDTSSYGILMDVCATCKDVKSAGDFMEEMRRRRVPPTINTYVRFMRVFVAANDNGVVEVFENMKRHGPKPNLEAYTVLLQYYLATRNDAIYPLFEEMKKEGVDPDLNAYNTMLNYTAQAQNIQRTFMYLNQLSPLPPDIDTYNALMAAFAPTGHEYIQQLFNEMPRNNVAPDATTIAILMKFPKGRQALATAVQHGRVKVSAGLAQKLANSTA